jgi:hypothetical protein
MYAGLYRGFPEPLFSGDDEFEPAYNQVPVKDGFSDTGADRKLCLIWDTFSAHKRAVAYGPQLRPMFSYIGRPTNASWLNLIEPWFLVLQKTALYNTDLKTTDAIAEKPQQGIALSQQSSSAIPLGEDALI